MANPHATLDTASARMNQKDATPSHGQPVPGIEEDAGGGHGPEPTAFGLDAPAFISLAILFIIAIILWKRVPQAIGSALDKKIATIREQLDQAAKLRAEAEALRGEYEAKTAAADKERETMLERARHEAEAIVTQARADTAALLERRARMAEDKIAAAERQAIDEVRARAAAAAAAAAERLISEELDATANKAMVDKAIADLGRRH
jgi:F-type H+-transporting ATPase subunit b